MLPSLLWIGVAAGLGAPPTGTAVGEVHPDFVLPLVPPAGQNPRDRRATLRLSDHRGRKVVLLHFASW